MAFSVIKVLFFSFSVDKRFPDTLSCIFGTNCHYDKTNYFKLQLSIPFPVKLIWFIYTYIHIFSQYSCLGKSSTSSVWSFSINQRYSSNSSHVWNIGLTQYFCLLFTCTVNQLFPFLTVRVKSRFYLLNWFNF